MVSGMPRRVPGPSSSPPANSSGLEPVDAPVDAGDEAVEARRHVDRDPRIFLFHRLTPAFARRSVAGQATSPSDSLDRGPGRVADRAATLSGERSPGGWRGGKSRGPHDPMGLLDVAAIVRENQPPAVQDAVGHDRDEWRGHDRARGAIRVQRLQSGYGVLVLCHEPLDDVGLDVAARRVGLNRCGEATGRVR